MSTVLVAAIDFGPTYSGWAFSFKHEFERDPTHINAKHWHGDQLISSKAPTCVLINPDGKTFDSFGYTAESKYADLAAEDKHEEWYFFRRFKMMLFDKVVSGTVDITIHQVVVDDKVREVHKASGGDWGGTRIDLAYENFMTSIIGPGVMNTFKREHMDDFIDFFRAFEVKKREIPKDGHTKVTIRIPPSLNELVKLQTGKEITKILQERFDGKITYNVGKMRMNGNILKDLFDETVKKIIQHIKMLLKEDLCKECSTILMVGGFSECSILQDAIRKSFSNMNLIVPSDAGLAVLKGAVIYGHVPNSITERICKYTYGLKAQHRTSPKKCNHPETPKEVGKDGIERCINIFTIHVRKGQSVKLGEEQKVEENCPRYDDQTAISFIAYASKASQPKLSTEDGCFELGKITIPIEDTSLGRKRKFRTGYIFGGTEIVVKVLDTSTGKISLLSVDCLE